MTVESVTEHRGRLLAWIGEYDERSRSYAARAPQQAVVVRSRTWADPLRLDQGDTGTCVAQCGTGQLAADPIQRTGLSENYAFVLYDAIKQNQDHEADPDRQLGTSVLSLCKELKAEGLISSYRWCFSVDDVVHALSTGGTVMAGTDWYEGMFDPDENGYVPLTGNVVGGHSYLLRGVAVTREHVRFRNSWGAGWGLNGDGRLRWADLERLIDQQGEFAVVTETVP